MPCYLFNHSFEHLKNMFCAVFRLFFVWLKCWPIEIQVSHLRWLDVLGTRQYYPYPAWILEIQYFSKSNLEIEYFIDMTEVIYSLLFWHFLVTVWKTVFSLCVIYDFDLFHLLGVACVSWLFESSTSMVVFFFFFLIIGLCFKNVNNRGMFYKLCYMFLFSGAHHRIFPRRES